MTTQAITVSLVDVLAYRHPGVIRRYAEERDRRLDRARRYKDFQKF
jgi:hypothetical protein